MGINIKHGGHERVIRQLANHRRSSIIDAIGVAVRHKLKREGVVSTPVSFLDQVKHAQASVAAAPLLDPRPLS